MSTSILMYKVEDEIDFFKELSMSLIIEEKQETQEESAIHTNSCLITNEPLVDKYVTMVCGHKFNYVPLYKYLINYKQKFNSMESTKQRLELNEIRCPYCRNKQKQLLPYYDDLPGIKKVSGINQQNIIMEWSKDHPCCYEINFINNNSILCGNFYTSLLPEQYKEKNSQYYCSLHLKKKVQQFVKEEKEELKKQKAIEKQKLHEEKLKMKESEKNNKIKGKISKLNKNLNIMEENIILEPVNVLKCQRILKYGFNKGNQCSFHTFQDGLCKRHYQLEMKK